jgi:hypothetical protein
MQTILAGAIVIACTIGMVLFLFFRNRNNVQRKKKAIIDAFTEKAAGLGASFSSQEMLKDTVIGLDHLHQRLLVFDHLKTQSLVSIHLADVQKCVLTKEFQHVNYGSEKKSEMEKTLQSVVLKFSFKNSPDHFTLSFYDSMLYSIYEMAEMEEKAKKWEALLSQLIVEPLTVLK